MTIRRAYRGLTICMACLPMVTFAATKSTPVKPAGDPGGWVTPDDYPATALRANVTGDTGFRLEIDNLGHVAKCAVTRSSGAAMLDQAACAALTARARFSPALDRRGKAIAATYSSLVRWQIPLHDQVVSTSMASCAQDASAAIMVVTPIGCLQ